MTKFSDWAQWDERNKTLKGIARSLYWITLLMAALVGVMFSKGC